ncbi:right-handed parallel beta-helix repeat-containing protein, partial [bacterium]|nr:right-handed parallel beta-helix repeat-containing protein [bacterium]
MTRRLLLLSLFALLWPALVSPATCFGANYYVDGTNGDDGNSGVLPSRSWKTITHALDIVHGSPSSPVTVHLAKGVYSASTNGETLPLVMSSHVRLLGQGPETTVVDAEYNAHHLILCTAVQQAIIEGVGLLHSYPLGDEYSEEGGCPVICVSSSLLLRNCVIAENYAMLTEDAGAILCRDSDLTLESCLISDNDAHARFGPGGYGSPGAMNCEDSTLTIRSSVFERNQPDSVLCFGCVVSIETSRLSQNRGGAIRTCQSAMTMIRCEISGHSSHAVSIDRSSLIMQQCIVADNSTPVIQFDRAEAVIDECTIRMNGIGTSAFLGGNIQCLSSEVTIRRSLIADNEAGIAAILYSTAGGCDITLPAGYLIVENTAICNNSSDSGAAIYCENGWGSKPEREVKTDLLLVRNCTIVGNRVRASSTHEPCVIGNGWNVHFEDNLVWDNDGILFDWAPESPSSDRYFQVRNCCLQEEFEGEGNVVADPLFVSGPLGDYYLSAIDAGQEADSPCIDAGSTSASIVGMNNLTTRTDGEFDAGAVDIGYHYSATPPTIDCEVSDGSDAQAKTLDAQPFRPGDTLRALITVENGGLPQWVDIYAAFIMPDGTLLCLVPEGLTMDIAPYLSSMLLPQGLDPTS